MEKLQGTVDHPPLELGECKPSNFITFLRILKNPFTNIGRQTDHSDPRSLDDVGISTESCDTALTEPIVTSAEVDGTLLPDSLAASEMASDSVEKPDTAGPEWDPNPKPQDIHRPYPLTPGYGPAVCELANAERISFPLVANKTPGDALHCVLWALAIGMTVRSHKTDRLELQLEQYYRYQDLLENLNSDEFTLAIETSIEKAAKKPEPESVAKLASPKCLSVGQISALLLIYSNVKNESYRLAIVTKQGHRFVNACEENGNDPIIWICNFSDLTGKG